MISLIWKNISRRRTQSTLTVAITTMTILIFVLVMGILQIVTQGLRLSQERLGADAMLIPKSSSATGGDLLFTAIPENIYMSKDTLEQARELEGVAALSPQFYSQSFDASCCDTGTEVRIVGYDPETDFVLSSFLSDEARHVQSKEVIVGSNFTSDFLGLNYMLLEHPFKIISQIQPTGTGMDDMYFMHINDIRELCLTAHILAPEWEGKNPDDYISVIMVKLQDGADPQAFAQLVEQSDMEARCILTGETISLLQRQLEVTMKVMFALWVGSLIIAILALVGRFNALAKERKKEIGLLRAIGLTKGNVFFLIIGETCTMAAMGGILGSGFALMCMGPVINMLKDAFMLSPSVWTNSTAIFCAGCGVLMAVALGFVSAVSPALKSASMDPQTAIIQGEVN